MQQTLRTGFFSGRRRKDFAMLRLSLLMSGKIFPLWKMPDRVLRRWYRTYIIQPAEPGRTSAITLALPYRSVPVAGFHSFLPRCAFFYPVHIDPSQIHEGMECHHGMPQLAPSVLRHKTFLSFFDSFLPSLSPSPSRLSLSYPICPLLSSHFLLFSFLPSFFSSPSLSSPFSPLPPPISHSSHHLAQISHPTL